MWYTWGGSRFTLLTGKGTHVPEGTEVRKRERQGDDPSRGRKSEGPSEESVNLWVDFLTERLSSENTSVGGGGSVCG